MSRSVPLTPSMLSRPAQALEYLVSLRRSRFLIGVTLLALVLRVAFVLTVGVRTEPKFYEYGDIARNLVGGAGYTMHWWYNTSDSTRMKVQEQPPTHEGAFMPPLNPYIVASGFLAFGSDTPVAALALMLLYAGVGALTSIALYSTTRRFASEGAARLASIALAIFPPAIFSVTTFSGSVLFHTMGLVVMGLAIGMTTRPDLRGFLLLGLGCGIMVFLRSEFLMLGLLIVAVTTLLAVLKHGRRNLGPGVAGAVLMLLVVAPWTYRNYTLYHRIVPVISKPWAEVWRGNNEFATATSFDESGEANWFRKPHYRPLTYRFDSIPYDVRFELAADSIYREEVVAFVSRNPGRALSLAVQRVLLLWTVDINHPMARHPLYIAMILPTLALLLLGFIIIVQRWRRGGNLGPVVLYGVYFLFTSAIVAVTHVQPRHQIYLVIVAFPMIGIAAEWLIRGRTFRQSSTVAAR